MKIKPLSKNKKGMGIGDMYPTILTIAIAAILIAVVLLILDNLGENMATSSPVAGNITNESHTWTYALDTFTLDVESTNCSAHGYSITNVFNGSSAIVIDSGNYTLGLDTGIVTNTSALTGTDTWLVSYTYNHGGDACQVTIDVIDDFTDFIPWFGVILLIVAAAIVLGILIRNLAGGQRV